MSEGSGADPRSTSYVVVVVSQLRLVREAYFDAIAVRGPLGGVTMGTLHCADSACTHWWVFR